MLKRLSEAFNVVSCIEKLGDVVGGHESCEVF